MTGKQGPAASLLCGALVLPLVLCLACLPAALSIEAAVAAQAAKQAGKLYKLTNLTNRTARHNVADAVVYITAGFDAGKPVQLVIFNHGLTTGAEDTWRIWNLERYMHHAPPNTVVFLPEWAANPNAYSQAAGPFHNPGFFRRMLAEVFARVPELAAVDIDDLKDIAVMTFSGGWKASMTQLYANGMGDQITSLTLFDSLYRASAFDAWLEKNIGDLAAGAKTYWNFYFDTGSNSQTQLALVRRLLGGLPGADRDALLVDTARPKEVLPAADIAGHNIVIKYTTLYTREHIAHRQVVATYLPLVFQALALRAEARQGESSQ